VTLRRLEYAPRYFRRLEDICERIAADNPTAAHRMIERIRAAVTRLTTSPALGRPGRVADTRELVIPRTPYMYPIGSGVTLFRSSLYCTAPSDGPTVVVNGLRCNRPGPIGVLAQELPGVGKNMQNPFIACISQPVVSTQTADKRSRKPPMSAIVILP